jgi:uncharacterized damage-inducible protein DinB
MKTLRLALNLSVILAAILLAPQAQPQQRPAENPPPPTMASALNTEFGLVEREVVSAAEAMPEDKYSFAPSGGEFKGVRTFGEQVKHIAAANFMFGAIINGEKVDMEGAEHGPADIKTKAQIVQYLKDSFAKGHKAIAGLTPENAVVLLPNAPFPLVNTRLGTASFASAHCFDHYGQMVVYLRMNGIVPPASRPRN